MHKCTHTYIHIQIHTHTQTYNRASGRFFASIAAFCSCYCIHMHTYIHTHTDTHTHTDIQPHLWSLLRLHSSLLLLLLYTSPATIHIHTYTPTHTLTHTYTHTYIHTYIHTLCHVFASIAVFCSCYYTHTHIHTYIHPHLLSLLHLHSSLLLLPLSIFPHLVSSKVCSQFLKSQLATQCPLHDNKLHIYVKRLFRRKTTLSAGNNTDKARKEDLQKSARQSFYIGN